VARPSALIGGLREKAAQVLGRRPEPALLLLADLRHLYLSAAGNSLHWTMLAQAALTNHDAELFDVVSECRSRTDRQLHWFESMIKVLSPQALTTGR
jgi:hypothetical protein